MSDPRIDALEALVKKQQGDIAILSRWITDIHLALLEHGIHVAKEPEQKPHTFSRHMAGSPLLSDTTTPVPIDRRAGHDIHYEGQG